MYPKTLSNTQISVPDTGLWQHSMFMADCLCFANEENRSIYLKECMIQEICPVPSVVGNFNELTMEPGLFLRDQIRSSLKMDGKQTILYAPLLPGENYTDVSDADLPQFYGSSVSVGSGTGQPPGFISAP